MFFVSSFSAVPAAHAGLSPYQVLLSDSRPESVTLIEFSFVTHEPIPPSSTWLFSVDSAFVSPSGSAAYRNIRLTIDGGEQPFAATATETRFGAEETALGIIITSPSAVTVPAGSEVVALLGISDPFVAPSEEGAYAVSTGIDASSGTVIEYGAGYVYVMEGVEAGTDTVEEESSGSSGSSGSSASTTTEDVAVEEAETETEETVAEPAPSMTYETLLEDGAVDEEDIDMLVLLWDTPTGEATVDLNDDGQFTIQDFAVAYAQMSETTARTPSRRFPVGPPLSEDVVELRFERVTELRAAYFTEVAPTGSMRGTIGDVITVVIFLSTGVTPVAALQAEMSYDPAVMRVANVYTDESVLTSWIQLPTRTNGTVEFVGGVAGGFSGSNAPVAVIDFEMLEAGEAVLSFIPESTSVAYADARGTLAPLTVNASSVVASERPAQTDVPDAAGDESAAEISDEGADITSDGDLPVAPSITSPSHPDELVWYSDPDVFFQWTPAGPISYAWDHALDTVPDALEDIDGSEVAFSNVSDGEWAFHARSLCDGCSEAETSERRVRVDTTPPEPFDVAQSEVSLLGSPFPFIRFQATDAMSGVERYEIVANGKTFTARQGPFLLPMLNPGWYDVEVTAVDRAGNRRTAASRVKIGTGTDTFGFEDVRWAANLLLILLLVSFGARWLWRHLRRQSQ